jgi:hypothetical protein
MNRDVKEIIEQINELSQQFKAAYSQNEYTVYIKHTIISVIKIQFQEKIKCKNLVGAIYSLLKINIQREFQLYLGFVGKIGMPSAHVQKSAVGGLMPGLSLELLSLLLRGGGGGGFFEMKVPCNSLSLEVNEFPWNKYKIFFLKSLY